jgi:YVTN family beta-propeller protein
MKNLKKSSSILILFTIVFVLSVASMVHAVGIIATIPVGTNPEGLAYDSSMGEIFVANNGSDTVSVISDSSNTVVANLTTGNQPACLAYDSAKGEIFVTNDGSGTVSVISDMDISDPYVATVTVGTKPNGVAYDSGKGEIFVANWGSGTVSVISDKNNTVVATVPVGTNPVGVAYDSGKGEIFVANSYVTRGGNGSVSVISDSKNKVVATVPVGFNPFYPAYDSGKGEIFVPNFGDGSVSVISDKKNVVIANVTLPEANWTWGISYDSGKNVIFCTSGDYGSYSAIFVISDSNNAVVANVTQAPIPIGKEVSYASPLDVFPFYLANHPGDATITEAYSGCYPHGVVYDSAKGEIFVANNFSGNVSVISDASLPSASPTPTVPEFSTAGIILVVVALVVVSLCAVALAVRKLNRTNSYSKQTTKWART